MHGACEIRHSLSKPLYSADILGNYRKTIRTIKQSKRLSIQHQLINESEVGKVYQRLIIL